MLKENVLLSTEMLNVLNVLGGNEKVTPGQRIQHIQHFSRRKTHFRKDVVPSGEMLNMLNSGAPC